MAFNCEHCDSSFINKSSLNRHLRNIHQLQFGNLENKLCPICCKRGNKKHILNHFKTDHGITLDVVYKLFPDLDTFYGWKKEIEETTISSFVKVRQSQVLKDGSSVLYFHCHRDGIFTPSGSKKRNIKILGSNKINAFCPAQMTIRVDSSCVSVKFIETHVGHAKEFSRINYYKTVKKTVGAPKIIPEENLDQAKNLEMTEQITPQIFVRSLDNKQITKNRNPLDYSKKIDIWLQEMKTNIDSFIRFYKPQGKSYDFLQKEDIISVFFTDIQVELLRTFGNTIICVDGTHSLNKRVIQMFTLLVVDSTRQGLPCASMITNRTDAKVFKLFFETVKDSLRCDLTPDVFISDVNGIVYNGWKCVMPPARKYLYSWWYVDREWQTNLKKRVPVAKHSEIYKKLRILLEESSEICFKEKLNEILSYLLADPDTTTFAEYLSTAYDKNVESWAYCFRLSAGLNINISLERIHRTIKYMFLKGKKILINDAMENLLNFLKSRILESLKFIEKEKSLSLNNYLGKQHEITLGMEKNVSSVVKSGDEWVIICKDNSSYKVHKSKENCTCHTKCPLCHTCLHSSSCSCFNNSASWNVCSHMHYICASFKGMDSTDFSATFGERDYFEITINDLAPGVPENKGSNETGNEILTCKEQAKEKLFSILEKINKSNSLDEVKNISNLIDRISSEVNSGK